MNITVFLGAPGSGKGTQARRRLAQASGFKHFSTGDMLRAAIQTGSEVERRQKVLSDRGELVPDAIMIGSSLSRLLSKLGGDARVIFGWFSSDRAASRSGWMPNR